MTGIIGVNMGGLTLANSGIYFINQALCSDSFQSDVGSFPEDVNGYPTSMNGNSRIQKEFVFGLPYPVTGATVPGRYLILYQGDGIHPIANAGTIALSSGSDGVINNGLSVPGRIVVDIASVNTNQYGFKITATDPLSTGNYIRNVAWIDINNEALYTQGAVTNPLWQQLYSGIKCVRFMDAQNTLNNTQTAWSQRTPAGFHCCDNLAGAPIELLIKFANETNCIPWFCMPVNASDDCILQFANLVHGNLNKNLNCIVELGNELWNFNGHTTGFATSAANGLAVLGVGGVIGNTNWRGMRTAQMGTIWKTAWGSDASRLTVGMGIGSSGASAFLPGGNAFSTENDQIMTTILWTGHALNGAGGPCTFSGTVGNPVVVNLTNHGYTAGAPVVFTNTGGQLPFDVNVISTAGFGFVSSTSLTANSFKVTETSGGGGTPLNVIQTASGTSSVAAFGGAAPGGPAYKFYDTMIMAPYYGADGYTGVLIPQTVLAMSDGGLEWMARELAVGGQLTNVVAGFSTQVGGSGYANGSYTNVPLTGGTGTGVIAATLNVSGGVVDVNSLTWFSLGQGFTLGDVLTVNNTNLGGSGSGFALTVNNLNGSYTNGVNGGMLQYQYDNLSQWKTYANSWTNNASVPLALNCYEGGPSYTANGGAFQQLYQNIVDDPRMFNANKQFIANMLATLGTGNVFCYYQDAGEDTNSGEWGLLRTPTVVKHSPKYDGFQQQINPNRRGMNMKGGF